MKTRKPFLGCLIIAVMLLAIGCNDGPFGGGTDYDPLVFPFQGQLGSTAFVLIDSNYLTLIDSDEMYDLDASRVTIEIADAQPGTGFDFTTNVDADLRHVFDLGPSRRSKVSEGQPGMWFTAALFDMPESGDFQTTPTYPFMAKIVVKIDGVEVSTSRYQVTGSAGIQNTMADPDITGQIGFMDSLSPQRMVRYRGKRATGPNLGKFWEEQSTIGGIEFDFDYSPNCVTGIRPQPATDAANATAFVGPEIDSPDTSGYKRVHVVIVDPKGIEMVFLEEFSSFPSWRDTTLAGDGPLIDIALDDTPGQSCDITSLTEFKFRNLLVTDVDGVEILRDDGDVVIDTADSVDSNAVFRMYAVDVDDA